MAASIQQSFPIKKQHGSLAEVLENNKEWAKAVKDADPKFFENQSTGQTPAFLWIGCADSRVPPNQILGLAPGEVFVQRNVGNLATHKDMNCMSCLEYAVTALKVKHIIVCGHYGCGAVKGALTMADKTPGLVNLWITDIREVRDENTEVLKSLSGDDQWRKLVDLNALRQVFNVCTSPTVQTAWEQGQELTVHGVVYDLRDGLLKEVAKPITSQKDFKGMANSDSDNMKSLCKGVKAHLAFSG